MNQTDTRAKSLTRRPADARQRLDGLSGIDRLEVTPHAFAAHFDGVLSLPGRKTPAQGIAGSVHDLARQALHAPAVSAGQPMQQQARFRDRVRAAEENTAVLSATGAQLWLQPAAPRKLALQWNVPSNVRRNCRDLLGGEQAEYILRLYQRVPVASGWKAAHRTLEFAVDLSRRRCFIKLEQAGGTYSAELGVRLRDGQYVFLARSQESILPLPVPRADAAVEYADWAQQMRPAPDCPTCFRTPDCPAAADSAESNGADIADRADRDARAEARVRAVYTDFQREGKRVFRNRQRPAPLPAAERVREFTARNDARKQVASQPSAAVRPTPARTPATLKLGIERLDAVRSPAPVTQPAIQPLAYPPAPIAAGYDATKLSRAQALRFAPLLAFCRQESLLPVQMRPDAAHTQEAHPEIHRRNVIHVRGLSELAKVIRETGGSRQAEILLKGKVKPGRKVRVGGLLIETAADGSFCVACMIRGGRLFVPVEEVSAVYAE